MGKGAPSKGALERQLKIVMKLVEELVEEVRLRRQLEARRTPPEPEPEIETSRIEQLAQVIRETGDNIAQTILSRDAQRLEAMEQRVSALEHASQQTEIERTRLRESLRDAARQPTMKAPSQPPPIDYSPLLTAAVETVRDLGLCFLQRGRPEAQKPQAKGT